MPSAAHLSRMRCAISSTVNSEFWYWRNISYAGTLTSADSVATGDSTDALDAGAAAAAENGASVPVEVCSVEGAAAPDVEACTFGHYIPKEEGSQS